MHHSYLRQIVPIVLLLGLAAGSGCSAAAWKKVIPSRAPKTDVVPGLIPPHEQIAGLRRERLRTHKLTPQEAARRSLQLAERCADEEDPLLRAEIVKTLGALGTDNSRATLRVAIQEPNRDVRVAACAAWATIGDEEAVSELARALSSDTDPEVRIAAAKALGMIPGPRSVAALGGVLEDRDPAMQHVAMAGLRKTTGENFGNDARLWQQYVRGETPTRTETSIAGRIRELF